MSTAAIFIFNQKYCDVETYSKASAPWSVLFLEEITNNSIRKESPWMSDIWHLHSFVTEHPDLQTRVIPAALCAQNICHRLDTSLPWYHQSWSCFKTVEIHEAVVAGNLKPDITQSDVFNVNYFLHRTIKVAKRLLMFLASLPEISHFCPPSHHRPMPGHEGWGWEAP